MTLAAAPVLSPRQAAAWLDARRRQEALTVALANGCFDLLHVGHARYLAGAKAEADLLVVGVNGDTSVALLKGAGRPLLPAPLRAQMVASLRSVDLVTVFPEPTADALIRLLRPDVHCKGPDYAAGIPEQRTVESIGARVAIVGDPKNHSTGDLFARIAKAEP